MNKSHTTLKIVGSVAVVAALAAGTFMFIGSKKDDQNQEPVASNTTTSQSTQTSATDTQQTSQSPASPTTENTAQATPSASTVYKDGEYSVTTTYVVPEGDSNSLTTTLTIKNDTITAVTTSSKYANRESAQYVNGFKGSVSGAVVGKKLSGLSFSKIGGASLTTASFNKAINSIATNAKN